MGVYGNFLSAFPELLRTIHVWTKDDKSDTRSIAGVFLPTKGGKLKRYTFSNKAGFSDYNSTAIDYTDDDQLIVGRTFKDKVRIGDFFDDPDDMSIHRITGEVDYMHSGSFIVFITERVNGATSQHTEMLQVKEAAFD